MKYPFFLLLLLLQLNSKATVHKIVINSNCNTINNLCVGDTLRFCGDSLNPFYYGVINGYVYNSTTLVYDNFVIVSDTNLETCYDHILVVGDDYYLFQPCSPFEGYLDYTGCLITSEKEIIHKNKLNIFPNPNSGNFTIEFNSYQQNQTLFIFDLTGRIVHQENLKPENTEQKIITKNLSKGLYLLAIKDETGDTIQSSKISITN